MAEPDATQIVSGSGKLYVAPLGSALPTLDAHSEFPVVWPVAWSAVGYTEDGIDLSYTPTVKPLHVDEETAPVADVLTEEKVHIAAKLSESTLLNLSRAVSACTYTDDSSAESDINVKIGSKPLTYTMVGIEAPAPGTNLKRVIVMKKAIATAPVVLKIQRKDKVVIPVNFEGRQLSGESLVEIHDFTSTAS